MIEDLKVAWPDVEWHVCENFIAGTINDFCDVMISRGSRIIWICETKPDKSTAYPDLPKYFVQKESIPKSIDIAKQIIKKLLIKNIDQIYSQKKPVIHEGKLAKILFLRYTASGEAFALTTVKPCFGDWTRIEDLSLVKVH